MADLSLRSIRKSYANLEVLHGIDLDIRSGEFIVFVGPSGCGKSTLLRSIAGLETITSGDLIIDGERINNVAPSKRGISMVFQSYALYPHMTVFENMAFGLRIAGLSKAEIDKRVRNAAAILQLENYLQRLPKALSGGQRQRVAIGRAIVRDPRVFLFDEPLSNLDAALRVATRIEIAKLKQSMPEVTMIYVTHDQVEAMTLADRIVVFKDGYIEQVGTPIELYKNPANLFVAQFIGSPSMNILDGKVEREANGAAKCSLDCGVALDFGQLPDGISAGDRISIGVRPENTRIADATTDGPVFTGIIDFVEHLGEVQILYVDMKASERKYLIKVDGSGSYARGDTIRFTARAQDIHVFDANGSATTRCVAQIKPHVLEVM
ncbi:ABC transporter ATP-binding protein [Phyllobacterium endophyticum]|uniref:ABC transporter ATP-binding protein n=1 Tax=Phyllobacterium endophyticum TaxID=1149773 RepID=A0A2P7B1T8_9HYPH|nr:sn-glycerol-3-phosphate ABC transporter ATP-binding protein UgpC [Phyllobacterium endophyticum]MBB3238000.1 multiple sugar transport system ATP-binding protein/alpha-glucoside transport system ATP-binding protein [Phyllobacterium endophyticum]PSH60420.1 ABC transporter ATP-binding protein [Phyllobacterium endophyticum]TYR42597.1 sn-glycerol-3-phosphate ABC transporter ATP-binding protein UgpC [Phyllobacterium endophyticum]